MNTIVDNISHSNETSGNGVSNSNTISIASVFYTNEELKFCLADRRNRIKLHEIKRKRQRFNVEVDQTYARMYVDGSEILDRLYCRVCANIIAKQKLRGSNLKRHLGSTGHSKAKFLRQLDLVPCNLL